MALQATLTRLSNFGQETELQNLYIKVTSAYATKQEVKATVTALASVDGNALFTESHNFVLDLDGPNPIKQAYLYLKTLPEFADAVDC
jgi:hypothetical protein